MSWTIIIASGQGDQLDELMTAAEKIAEEIGAVGTVIMDATSVESVHKRRKKAGKRKQLLIVAAGLPGDELAHEPQGMSGLQLISAIAQEVEAPPCILVSADMKHFLAVQAISRCELLYVDCTTDYVRDCLKLAKKLDVFSAAPASDQMAGKTSPPVPPLVLPPARTSGGGPPSPSGGDTNYALVEVHILNNARSGFVTVGGRNPQPLELDQNAVDELVKESRALAERMNKARDSKESWRRFSKQWSIDYQRLGERVGALLWPTVFRDLYRIGYGETHGNVRLRFNLDQPYFDGAWEAIYDDLARDFVMLGNTVTVTRRANQFNSRSAFSARGLPSASGQIDVNDGVLNLLIIQSNVSHNSIPIGPADQLWQKYWDSLKGSLSELPHIEKEIKMLRGLAGGGKGGTSRPQVNVDVLAPRAGKPLVELVEGRLKDRSRQYDIVHFAGHALFARSPVAQDRRGYLVFSGEPGEPPEAVPIATVADWLDGSGVQLVYLSCCRSSAAAAAIELAAKNVPLTIGFNWDLDDTKAVDFARDFYMELLNARLKVCSAFSKARRNLHGYFAGGDPIWAAPILIAQPEEWVQVEGVLRPISLRQLAPKKTSRRQPPRKFPRDDTPAAA